jgi:hypothetical protein
MAKKLHLLGILGKKTPKELLPFSPALAQLKQEAEMWGEPAAGWATRSTGISRQVYSSIHAPGYK